MGARFVLNQLRFSLLLYSLLYGSDGSRFGHGGRG
ncbi:hypothetical protein MTY_2389 [Moorella thermoacetica Y72]|uniref:Uncharacterized protein n=1 Tax=Moorella thermoacetica Y72 TaxID=1325331 RepID=A0A0S6UGF0_NEOTH|nr:hypothetical protein MTY_2389 [Moorella thermoacetica Y72]